MMQEKFVALAWNCYQMKMALLTSIKVTVVGCMPRRASHAMLCRIRPFQDP
jgi:hypothetical protein